ncbi:MAG: kelch repeat-containing protein [Candidatus Dojkabacteria bacterium]
MKELRNERIKNKSQIADNRLIRSVICHLLSMIFVLLTIITLNLISTNQIHAAINNVINFQTKMIVKSTLLNITSGTPPTCVVSGADTCDFRVRIWNLVSGGTATAGNNLMYEELFNNVELGDGNGIFTLSINSVCGATSSSTHQWGTTGASATVCNLFDDNADTDTTTGIDFARTDLYLEVTFDPSGAWTTLASPPGGIEIFTRTNLTSVPSAYATKTINGLDETGFVQLNPSAVQSTSSSSGAIRVNQTGSGNVIQLQQAGSDKFVLSNAGQLALAQTGATGGLVIGGDVNLYNSTTNVLKTDDNLIVDGTNSTEFSVLGYSEFKGNLKAITTVSNGSTTATGTGSSVTTLVVSSTTNFDVGNLVLINGSTYAIITKVESSTALTVNPAVSWSNGQTVVEYTAPDIGGNGTNVALLYDRMFTNNGLRVGSSTNSTTYGDQSIGGGKTNPFAIDTGTNSLNMGSSATVGLNTTKGLIINKAEYSNVAGSWSTGTTGGVARHSHTAVTYNGNLYVWGGSTGSVINSLDIYNFSSKIWTTGTAGGTARRYHVATVFNDKMYAWGGFNSGGTRINTVDIYDLKLGTWSTGATGGTAKDAASGVVYNNKWYIWGGSTGSVSNTMDIYDFAANSWTTGTTGGIARFQHTAIVYNDKMYVWAGNNGGVVNSMDIYDFSANSWATGTAGGAARQDHVATVFDNKMYGWGGTNGSALNSLSIYDFALDSWSTGTAGGTARIHPASAVFNNQWYNWGGDASGAINTMDIYDFGIKDTVLQVNVGDQQRLNIDQNNVITLSSKSLGLQYISKEGSQYTAPGWTTGTTGGTARNYGVTVEYNDKMYIWGGCTTTGCTAYYNTLDIFDLKTSTWSTGTAGGTGRWAASATIYDGKIYIIMGTLNIASSSVTNAVDIYDIATDTWSTGTGGGTARGGASAVLWNAKIYIWGGINGTVNINTVDIYDPVANSWSTGTAGGTARRWHSAVLYKNRMYNFGGFIAAATNTVDIYDLVTNSWTTGTAGGNARYLGQLVEYNGKLISWAGFTTAASTAMDVYDIERNVWSVGTAGGTARYGQFTIMWNAKLYGWGGLNTGGGTQLNTMDIYDFGISKTEDIFYIANQQGVGGGDSKLFRFDATGRAYTSSQGGWFSVGADYAEYMHTSDTNIQAGDIVKLDLSDGKSISKASKGDEVIGVISTDPGFVGNITSVEDINRQRADMKLLSMVGQVPVKVSRENGPIKVGDRIGISSQAGIGMRVEEGEDNIGIAQESFDGESIGGISVLITRNNSGINNKVQINLGTEGEAGFRLSNEGKLQYKDKEEDWKNIDQQISVDTSVIWKKIGDNIYDNNNGVTSIGVPEENLDGSKLQIAGDIEIKDGLKYVKISASEGSITFNSSDIGFRLNSNDNSLEFKDSITQEWKKLSGLVISNSKVNPDGSNTEIKNVEQVSGWGYIKGDNTTSLVKSIGFGKNYGSIPVVITDISGSSTTEPANLSSCIFDESIVTITPYSIDTTKFNLNIRTDQPSLGSKYYCYTWRALGN